MCIISFESPHTKDIMWYFSFSDLLPLVLHSLKLSFTSWDRAMDTLSHLGDCSGSILYKMEGNWAMTVKEWAPVTCYWSAQKDDYCFGILLIYYCGSMEYKREEWREAVLLLFLLSLTRHCWCFLKKILFVYFWPKWVFTAMHGLSPAVVSPGYSLIVVHGLLIVVAFRVVEHGLPRGWGLQ